MSVIFLIFMALLAVLVIAGLWIATMEARREPPLPEWPDVEPPRHVKVRR